MMLVVLEPHANQALAPIVVDYIVECPWEQTPSLFMWANLSLKFKYR
jgi:hypothetical protein